jgi:hypothetical protein
VVKSTAYSLATAHSLSPTEEEPTNKASLKADDYPGKDQRRIAIRTARKKGLLQTPEDPNAQLRLELTASAACKDKGKGKETAPVQRTTTDAGSPLPRSVAQKRRASIGGEPRGRLPMASIRRPRSDPPNGLRQKIDHH